MFGIEREGEHNLLCLKAMAGEGEWGIERVSIFVGERYVRGIERVSHNRLCLRAMGEGVWGIERVSIFVGERWERGGLRERVSHNQLCLKAMAGERVCGIESEGVLNDIKKWK